MSTDLFGDFVYTGGGYGDPYTTTTTTNSQVNSKYKVPQAYLPEVFGRRLVTGTVIHINVIGGRLHLLYALCNGEVESITDIALNATPVINLGAIVEAYSYTGALGQGASPLAAEYARSGSSTDFDNNLSGTAYVYLILEPDNGTIQDMPTLTAVVKGRKLYDPRTGAVAYSANPALALLSLMMSSPTYKGSINYESFSAAADHCDTLAAGANGEKRYEFNYVFTQGDERAAIEIIRTHFLGALRFDQGSWTVYYARELSFACSFSQPEIYNVSISRPESQTTFNVVKANWAQLEYKNLQGDQWGYEETQQEYFIEAPELNADGAPYLEKALDLGGFQLLEQAMRVALYTLNSRINDLSISFSVFNNKGLEPLDCFAVTSDLGLTDKQFLCTALTVNPDGSTHIEGFEYDPAVFADTVVTEPTYADTTLPLPSDIPLPPTGLTLKEQVYKLADGTYLSKLLASWTASTSLFVKSYDVWVQEGSSLAVLHNTTDTRFELRAVRQLVTYNFKVASVTKWDRRSDQADASIVGKVYAEESIVTDSVSDLIDTATGNLQFTLEADTGTVALTWDSMIDPLVLYYEIRQGSRSGDWDTATKIGESKTGEFAFPLDEANPKIYVCAKYDSATTPYSSVKLSVDLQTLAAPVVSVKVVEPNIIFSWAAVAEADKYKLIIDSGGIAKKVWADKNEYTLSIPKYNVILRAQAWDNLGYFSQWAEEEITVSGIYKGNELVNVPISSFTNGAYINMCFTGANEVKKPSVAGTTVALPIANLNDSDLFNFARKFDAVNASSIESTPSAYFRDRWWLEKDGWFESAVTDLGALYSGRLICSINKTNSHLGNDITQWDWLLAEYVQGVTGAAMSDTKVHLEADLYVSADNLTWKAAQNDDWVTNVRYVKIVASVLQASPLSECKVTSGAVTIDVPDITESRLEIGLTGISKAVTFTKIFNACSVALANAIGSGLNAWATNVTKTGFTLNYTTGTTSAYWWVKGY